MLDSGVRQRLGLPPAKRQRRQSVTRGGGLASPVYGTAEARPDTDALLAGQASVGPYRALACPFRHF